MHDLKVVPLKPTADPMRRLGTVELGSFRLEEVIGRGSHGTTYLATQLGFDRQAVVKIAYAELFESRNHELVRRRFAEELRAATRVTHPNLVTLFTAGETAEGLPAIAMELVPGDSFEDLLAAHAGGLPLDLLGPAFAQLAAALGALHENGLVHRDLSPRCIMLDLPAGHPPKLKVLDFGLSMLRGTPRHSGGTVGTHRYMAPEQIIGRAVPASDVFAMGAMLWWALTGQEYHSDTLTLEDLQQHELEGFAHVDPRSVAPGLPERISVLVGDMLAYSEHERPTTDEFLATWAETFAELDQPRPTRAPSVPPPPPTKRMKATTGPYRVASMPDHMQPLSKRSRSFAGAAGPEPSAQVPDQVQPRARVDSVSAPPTYDSLPAAGYSDAPLVDAPPVPGPRVLVVDANAITEHLVAGCLRRNGCRVRGTPDPRDATRSASDEYDLVVLSTEIPDADPLDIARYLQEYHPEQWVVLAGDGVIDEAMRAAGVRELLAVPGGLPRLGELVDLLRGELALRDVVPTEEPDAVDRNVLDALRADDPMVVQETIEIFVGQTPESFARIGEGYQRRDAKAVYDECRVLSTSARALGANHLARLAQAAAEIVDDGDIEHVPGFIAEMEREYAAVFRALMQAYTTSANRTHAKSRT